MATHALPGAASPMPAKVIPFSVELLHPSDPDAKLVSIQVARYGQTMMITAVAGNGASDDEMLAEVAAMLQARHGSAR